MDLNRSKDYDKNKCPHGIMRKEESFSRMNEQSSFEV